MRKKSLQAAVNSDTDGPLTLGRRRGVIRSLNTIDLSPQARGKYTTKIQHIADALVAAGYTSLDEQAKALGVHRATAWTIIKTKHKLDRLNTGTTNRMLANPRLPPSVRIVLLRYLTERSNGLRRVGRDD
jgi:hypothetical protein